MEKIRYVVQRFRDKDKTCMVHDASRLRPSSICRILAVAACCRFRIFSVDVTQAYLESRYRMKWDVYIDPEPSNKHLFDLKESEVLKLELLLYGVCYAWDYWRVTVHQHDIYGLGMDPASGE